LLVHLTEVPGAESYHVITYFHENVKNQASVTTLVTRMTNVDCKFRYLSARAYNGKEYSDFSKDFPVTHINQQKLGQVSWDGDHLRVQGTEYILTMRIKQQDESISQFEIPGDYFSNHTCNECRYQIEQPYPSDEWLIPESTDPTLPVIKEMTWYDQELYITMEMDGGEMLAEYEAIFVHGNAVKDIHSWYGPVGYLTKLKCFDCLVAVRTFVDGIGSRFTALEQPKVNPQPLVTHLISTGPRVIEVGANVLVNGSCFLRYSLNGYGLLKPRIAMVLGHPFPLMVKEVSGLEEVKFQYSLINTPKCIPIFTTFIPVVQGQQVYDAIGKHQENSSEAIGASNIEHRIHAGIVYVKWKNEALCPIISYEVKVFRKENVITTIPTNDTFVTIEGLPTCVEYRFEVLSFFAVSKSVEVDGGSFIGEYFLVYISTGTFLSSI
uniref:Fibronectin type-III domain-containing protein n=1 Tax=Echinostoma caproni TaxID=27848 RepID=A0A183AUK1_9TREM